MTTPKHQFKLTTKAGTVMHTEAIDSKKAMTSFQRKRNKYRDSYSSVAGGTIEDLGLTEEAKLMGASTDLHQLLLKETESLRVQYLEMNRVYADEDFNRQEKLNARTREEWYKVYEVAYTIEEGEIRVDSKEYNGRRLYKMRGHMQEVHVIVLNGREKYIAKRVADAEDHYQHSILKLTHRVAQKGLDQANIKLSTSHVGVNIETTITDGTISVRAWTIIASGPVIRPHYRYLIK